MLKIKEIRTKKKLTQDDIVSITGIKKRSYVDYENQKADITLSKLQIIANALNVSVSDLIEEDKEENVTVHALRTDSIQMQQRVPYYNLTATASVLEAFVSNAPEVPLNHISIPNLPKCDGALNITGDSMYPLLKSGDIVMYRNVHDKSNIIWGEMYLLYINCDGDEFFFCKYIHKSDKQGYVKLVSQNKHHEPKDFHVDCIKQLAIVKASIRMNSVV
nr:XRE family transcriptional regulator [Tamlana carrageenivorans]